MRRIMKAPIHLALPALLLIGCIATPIGDPCTPEVTPEGGFRGGESYLETNSAQCRTGVCIVHHLEGYLDLPCDESGGPPGCVTEAQRYNHAFCSCRCSLEDGGDPNLPLCECGDGFHCADVSAGAGGDGVRGDYCLPCITPGNPRELDVGEFELCPEQ